MLDVKEYIKLSKEERQKHILLDEDCIERGGNSSYLKGLLAHILNTTIPSGKKIHVCHACHNGKCSNPYHIYWGTPSENKKDELDAGGKTIWQHMVEKYGLEGAREKQRRSKQSASLSGKGNLGKPKTEKHKEKISKSLSNKIHLTNGIRNITLNRGDIIPYGYRRGMIHHKGK